MKMLPWGVLLLILPTPWLMGGGEPLFITLAICSMLVIARISVSSPLISFEDGWALAAGYLFSTFGKAVIIILPFFLIFLWMLAILFSLEGILRRSREIPQLRWAMLIGYFSKEMSQ